MHHGSGSVNEVKAFFDSAAEKCITLGINKSQLCFDMGIGFGKDYEQNLSLIGNVDLYKKDGYPLLFAASRKRVIAQSSGQADPVKRVYGNIAADTAAILGGADIIRIHDLKNEIQGIRTAEAIKKWII